MKKNKIFNNKFLIGTNIFFIAVIILLLVVVFRPAPKNNNIINHDQSNSFVLTNPILDCDIDDQDKKTIVFSNYVNNKVEELKNKYFLLHISLYFRDLNNGPWVGVNEKETFSPASLLKVPLLIEFLNEAEKDPSLFDKKILIKEDDINTRVTQDIKSSNLLILNKEYSLIDVVKSMIEKSDNTAVSALIKNINKNNIGDVFKSIGVPYKDASSEVDVKVKDYAGFFRVLFNASYLNREMSEKALEILTKSEYNDGLVAGVPSGVTVAHKFGERKINGINNGIQLHDCGIIYYPQKPYILCIMTRGNNFDDQTKVIKELSSYIYKEVGRNY